MFDIHRVAWPQIGLASVMLAASEQGTEGSQGPQCIWRMSGESRP